MRLINPIVFVALGCVLSSLVHAVPSSIKIIEKEAPKNLRKIPLEQGRLVHKSVETVLSDANSGAKIEPREDGYLNASMIYDFERGALYQVHTSPNRVTLVSLEQGESVLEVHSGDTLRWQINSSVSGQGKDIQVHVTIKPLRADIETNIVILTDRRIYYVEAKSHQKSSSYMANVSWRYPSSTLLIKNVSPVTKEPSPIDGLDLDSLNSEYHFVAKKKPSWMPKRVFDDGQKTYIEFPASVSSREAPGLFMLSTGSDREIINFRTIGRFYIIDRLLDMAELRTESEWVGIERNGNG